MQRRASSKICEIEVLRNPQFLPGSCKSKYIELDVSVWNWLIKTDSWIYFPQSEYVTLNIKNPQESFQFNVKCICRISIVPSCTLHTDMTILSPVVNKFSNYTLNIVSEKLLFSISNIKETNLNGVSPQTLNHIGLYKNLRQIKGETIKFKKYFRKETYILVAPIEYHIIFEYLCILIVIIIIVTLSIKFKKQSIHIYKPWIAETEC